MVGILGIVKVNKKNIFKHFILLLELLILYFLVHILVATTLWKSGRG
jgi:hypothetical protein